MAYHVFGHHIAWVKLNVSNQYNVNLPKGYQDTTPSTVKVD